MVSEGTGRACFHVSTGASEKRCLDHKLETRWCDGCTINALHDALGLHAWCLGVARGMLMGPMMPSRAELERLDRDIGQAYAAHGRLNRADNWRAHSKEEERAEPTESEKVGDMRARVDAARAVQDFAEDLAAAMEERGLTAGDLARSLQCTEAYVKQVLSWPNVQLDMAAKLARAAGLTFQVRLVPDGEVERERRGNGIG